MSTSTHGPAHDASSTPPTVTVVVPTRNRSRLLALTLRSILAQAGVNVDVVVVDDGSHEDPRTTVSELRDPRVQLIRHAEPAGVSAARNHGLDDATGAWIAFCDDDDLWAPEKLARQIQAAQQASVGWAYSGAVYIDLQQCVRGGSPPLPPEDVVALLHRWNPIPGGCSNVVIERGLLERVGPFDSALGTLADWDLWLRIVALGPPSCVARPDVGYRVHHTNMSLDAARTVRELEALEARHRLDVDRARVDRFLARQWLTRGRHREALRLLALAASSSYSRQNIAATWDDLAMLWRHAEEGVRRRLHLDSARRRQRRHRRQRLADPNVEWKADAQTWLDELTEAASRTVTTSGPRAAD